MDESPWQYRCFIVAPAADKDAINAAIVAAALDAVGGAQTLTVELSADGQEPATHYWCSSKLTTAGVTGLLNMAPSFPNSNGYVWAEDGNQTELETMFSGVPNVTVGEVARQQVLAARGLQTLHQDI